MSIAYFAFIIGCVCVLHVEGETCFKVTCFEEGCLENATKAGNAETCTMDTNYGCQYTKMSGDSTAMEIADCSHTACSPLHNAPGMDKECCMENNCNTGVIPVPDPSSKLCHSYMCTTGYDCLATAIQEGHTRTCEMNTNFGCYIRKSSSAGHSGVKAGCNDQNNRCYSSSVIQGDTKAESICCSTNLCNNDEGNTGGSSHTAQLSTITMIIAGFVAMMNVY